MLSAREAGLLAVLLFVLVSAVLSWRHDTKWGEKAPPGCKPCPKAKEGLFDTPICGKNGIAYKNYCYLELRNCIAKKLNKPDVLPSKSPTTCGLQMKMYNTFGGPFIGKKKKRAMSDLLNAQLD